MSAVAAPTTESSDAPAAPEPTVETVADVPDLSRYEARAADGTLMGWLDYERRKQKKILVTTHTVTLPEFRGRGVASKMVTAVFDDAAKSGERIDPACWYVAEFIQHHPKYARQVVDYSF